MIHKTGLFGEKQTIAFHLLEIEISEVSIPIEIYICLEEYEP